jgi:hypothetical protein
MEKINIQKKIFLSRSHFTNKKINLTKYAKEIVINYLENQINIIIKNQNIDISRISKDLEIDKLVEKFNKDFKSDIQYEQINNLEWKKISDFGIVNQQVIDVAVIDHNIEGLWVSDTKYYSIKLEILIAFDFRMVILNTVDSIKQYLNNNVSKNYKLIYYFDKTDVKQFDSKRECSQFLVDEFENTFKLKNKYNFLINDCQYKIIYDYLSRNINNTDDQIGVYVFKNFEKNTFLFLHIVSLDTKTEMSNKFCIYNINDQSISYVNDFDIVENLLNIYNGNSIIFNYKDYTFFHSTIRLFEYVLTIKTHEVKVCNIELGNYFKFSFDDQMCDWYRLYKISNKYKVDTKLSSGMSYVIGPIEVKDKYNILAAINKNFEIKIFPIDVILKVDDKFYNVERIGELGERRWKPFIDNETLWVGRIDLKNPNPHPWVFEYDFKYVDNINLIIARIRRGDFPESENNNQTILYDQIRKHLKETLELIQKIRTLCYTDNEYYKAVNLIKKFFIFFNQLNQPHIDMSGRTLRNKNIYIFNGYEVPEINEIAERWLKYNPVKFENTDIFFTLYEPISTHLVYELVDIYPLYPDNQTLDDKEPYMSPTQLYETKFLNVYEDMKVKVRQIADNLGYVNVKWLFLTFKNLTSDQFARIYKQLIEFYNILTKKDVVEEIKQKISDKIDKEITKETAQLTFEDYLKLLN